MDKNIYTFGTKVRVKNHPNPFFNGIEGYAVYRDVTDSDGVMYTVMMVIPGSEYRRFDVYPASQLEHA